MGASTLPLSSFLCILVFQISKYVSIFLISHYTCGGGACLVWQLRSHLEQSQSKLEDAGVSPRSTRNFSFPRLCSQRQEWWLMYLWPCTHVDTLTELCLSLAQLRHHLLDPCFSINENFKFLTLSESSMPLQAKNKIFIKKVHGFISKAENESMLSISWPTPQTAATAKAAPA